MLINVELVSLHNAASIKLCMINTVGLVCSQTNNKRLLTTSWCNNCFIESSETCQYE